MFDNELLPEIAHIWLHLLKFKKIQAKIVYDRIEKDKYTSKQLEEPNLAKDIEKSCYHDIASELSKQIIRSLDILTELGYVEKKNEIMHHIGFHYEAHPYLPHIFPTGVVGIRSNSSSHVKLIDLDSKQYSIFVRTARDFKIQIDEGKHTHVSAFDFGEIFQYETIVYELKDQYTDAIFLTYSDANKNLIVELVEPIIISRNKIDSKNWIKVLDINTNLFFSERQMIDKLIDDNLPWKRTIIGEVIYDNKAYRIIKQEQEQKHFLEMPDFLGEGVFSIENIYSRIFEDATELYLQEYLREEPYYSETTPRKKFPYLGGREIDVYGIKKARETVIVICECKFRLNGSHISKDELWGFHEKTKVIKENEQKNLPEVYFCWWFVTNTDNIPDESKELAKIEGIKIKKAVINRNWRKMSTWKITKMIDIV